ncbi:MAG: CHASE2 domain-containing protein [Reyranellaceae bacterium]
MSAPPQPRASALRRFLAERAAGTRPSPLWLLAIAALAAALIVLRLGGGTLFAAAEGVTLDWRFQWRGTLPAPRDIVIVAIDDRSIAELRRFPPARAALAMMAGRLHQAGASVIAFDLLLAEPEQPSDGIRLSPGDQALVEAARSAGTLVLGAAGAFRLPGQPLPEAIAAAQRAAVPAERILGDRAERLALLPAAPDFLPPFPALAALSGLGHVNVPVASGGALRQLPLFLRVQDHVVPGFALVAALRHAGHELRDMALDSEGVLLPDGRRVAADPGLGLALNYYGGRGHIETLSAIDLLDGKVPAEKIKGRLAMIGAAALGVGDSFATPFAAELPGVEVLATAAANILQGNALVRDDRTLILDLLLIGLLCYAGYVGAGVRSLPFAAGLTLLVWAAWLVGLQKSFEARLWLDGAAPTLALLAAGLLSLSGRVQAQRRLSRRLARERENLAQYQSPIIAETLAQAAQPEFDGRPQNAGILFVDVAAFTGRAERIGPQATVAFLREFHARLEKVVLAHDGMIEHFMGDGAMVIFGVPRQQEEDAARTLACAQALLADVAAWDRELRDKGLEPVQIGVGVHFGPVVMATLGGERQRHVTAAGDTVNVSSRLQSLTRTIGAPLVASDGLVRAVAALGRSHLLRELRPLPAQPIRGRDMPMVVWTSGEMESAAAPPRSPQAEIPES